MKTFFTYILYSDSWDKYYVGSTGDLSERIKKHSSGHVKSTKGGAPWQIKHFEKFDSRSAAVKRERFIKSKKSRKYIEALLRK